MGLQRYYLGCPPSWLRNPPPGLPGNVGLFVSHRRLSQNGRDLSPTPYPPAVTSWALDSGGFSEIAANGRYTFTPARYVRAVHRYAVEIGRLEWAAQMDWMCEPEQIVRTGLSLEEHQRRTVANYLELRALWADLAPELPFPFRPALQGYLTVRSYLACVDLFEDAGVRLDEQPLVCVGSVCRLSTSAGVALLRGLAWELEQRYPGRRDAAGAVAKPAGLRLHAFGLTTLALTGMPPAVVAADSHAWSRAGRHIGRCEHPGSGVAWEQNCPVLALDWLDRCVRGSWVPDLPAVDEYGQTALNLFA
jgi:hypothetical protein